MIKLDALFFVFTGEPKSKVFFIYGETSEHLSNRKYRLLSQTHPIEVNLSNHPDFKNLFEHNRQLDSLPNTNLFVDPESFQNLLDKMRIWGNRRIKPLNKSRN